jgi:hypothetical protein
MHWIIQLFILQCCKTQGKVLHKSGTSQLWFKFLSIKWNLHCWL